jgi:RNA polymerase sigma factor (sigma-70 family)
MSSDQAGTLLQHIRRLAGAPDAAEPSDGQLLRRFTQDRDEPAFAALVQRHGRLVLGVCRRLLRHEQDAEDAFQATFLILARKAGSVRQEQSLAGWLYRVAARVAGKAQAMSARRRARERQAGRPAAAPDPPEPALHELQAILTAEVDRLPAKYRTAFVLCHLEGKTRAEAARELGWPEGTVGGRVAQARLILQQRLTRRGVVLSAALTAVALAEATAPAAVPPALIEAAGSLAAGTAGCRLPVRELADAGSTTMLTGKLKVAAVLLAVFAGAGMGVLAYRAWPAPRPQTPPSGESHSEVTNPDAGRPAVDRHGDPLPAGAVTRLGTLRFRTAHTVSRLAFAADGNTLLGAGWDNIARVWDRSTGKERRKVVFREDWRNSFAVSPDGKLLATGGRDKDRKLRLWDAGTGKLLFESAAQEGRIEVLEFSPDGKTLAAAGNKAIHLWDVAARMGTRQLAVGQDRLGALAFAPDGKLLAVACGDNRIRLWDLETATELRTLEGHKDWIYGLAFSPDGTMLASSGADKDRTVRLWDPVTGKELRRLEGPAGWVRPVAFSPDGKTLATGGQDGKVRLWDAGTGKEKRQLRIPGQDDTWGPWVMAVAFSPDGRTLAASGTEHVVRLWDLATGAEDPATKEGHVDGANSAAFSPDGKLLATASGDHTVRLWDPATGEEVRRLGGGREGFSRVTFAPDGKTVAALTERAVVLWDAGTGKELHRLEGHTGPVSSLCFSPDGKTLVSGGYRGDGTLRAWEVSTGKQVRQIGKWDEITSVAFSPDGKLLAVGLGYLNIALLDAATGAEVRRLKFEKGFARTLAFSPDGTCLASTGGLGNTVHLWEVGTGKELRRLTGHTRIVNAVVFSPDGRLLASAGQDLTVRLWEAVTGKEVRRFTGHGGQGLLGGIDAVAFAPDGRTLASVGDDTTGLLWDVTGLLRDGRLPAVRLQPAELEACWSDLAGDDAGRAQRAVWTLTAAAEQAVPLLTERLPPVRAADPAECARLVRDLDSDQFETREKATAALEKLGEPARPALRKALEASPTAEARNRLEKLLARMEEPASTAEGLRTLRAVAVLEHIDSPAARGVLEGVAGGLAEASRTQEAKAALGRCDRKHPPVP